VNQSISTHRVLNQLIGIIQAIVFGGRLMIHAVHGGIFFGGTRLNQHHGNPSKNKRNSQYSLHRYTINVLKTYVGQN
jgi:hypothetical protein